MPPAEANEIPKYELPAPVDTGVESGVDNKQQTPEKAAGPETGKSPSPKFSSPSVPTSDDSFQQPAISPQPAPITIPLTVAAGNPAIADDNDLIEKEWVTKAKKIIEETNEDPFKQSQEITVFKADYMKKRYNKVIKVAD